MEMRRKTLYERHTLMSQCSIFDYSEMGFEDCDRNLRKTKRTICLGRLL